jgi:hypothetical protein
MEPLPHISMHTVIRDDNTEKTYNTEHEKRVQPRTGYKGPEGE